uniref:Uncharacterized protein n=1 Tax=viral metagenome TaxID=1070528 RepID=A0A6C0KP11_9ZZZZ
MKGFTKRHKNRSIKSKKQTKRFTKRRNCNRNCKMRGG